MSEKDSERTFVVELRVSSSDGEIGLDYFGESIEEVLDAGTFQDAVCRHLEDCHPVNTEILSALLRETSVPDAPDWEELRAEEEGPDARRIMASFAEDRRVKVLPYEAEVEVIPDEDGPHPHDVLWTFRVLVPKKAVEDMEGTRYPERETDYSRLVEVFARAGVTLKSRGSSAEVEGLGLDLRFDAAGRLEAVRRLPDPMELTLGEAQSLAEWATEGELLGGTSGWALGRSSTERDAMIVARRIRQTGSEVFSMDSTPRWWKEKAPR